MSTSLYSCRIAFGWSDEEMVIFKLKYGKTMTEDEFNKEARIITTRQKAEDTLNEEKRRRLRA